MKKKVTKLVTNKSSSKAQSTPNISMRKRLSEISFRIEDINSFEEKDFVVTKEKLPDRESLTKGFLTSTAGKASEQLAFSREKIEKDLEEIDLDVKKLAEKGKNVSEEERRLIHQEFDNRRKKGTINEKQLELTVALESKVKSIRKAGQQVQRILRSSTLKKSAHGNDNITIEEHKANVAPKMSIKPLTNNKYLFWATIISAILFIVMLIAFVAAIVV